MNNSPLEFLAKKYGNVVKYDKDGNVAGIFVRFNKMKSSDLVAGLPEHTHPAFIINNEEKDSILLGKYKAGENGVSGDALVSLPNIMPARSLGADQCLSRMKMAASDITGMTCADYGFIKLLAQKEGWNPHGNNYWGQDYRDATAWSVNSSVTEGQERAYEGYLYKCLISHKTVAELKPDIAPTYWKRGEFIGGISQDNAKDTNSQTGYRTLNGSGPLDWYLGNDPANMADLIGSSLEQQYGYRIVDCELQILENNNAADPDADLSATSAAWKAILPHTSDDGFSLVSPGTSGTLHWNFLNNKIVLDTQCDDLTLGSKGMNFKDLTANTDRLPYVPYIVKELGLFPTDSDDKTQGYYYVNFTTGERFPRRGGHYSHSSNSGLGYVFAGNERGYTDPGYGCRPRSQD
jgi:hypothetical protein